MHESMFDYGVEYTPLVLCRNEVTGFSEIRALFDRKFTIVGIVQFLRFQRFWTWKICEISWLIIKNLWNENSACRLAKNSNSVGKYFTKIQKVILEAFHGDFLLKIGIIWFRDIRKTSHSKIMRAHPKPLPQLSIMESWNIFSFMKMHD